MAEGIVSLCYCQLWSIITPHTIYNTNCARTRNAKVSSLLISDHKALTVSCLCLRPDCNGDSEAEHGAEREGEGDISPS